MCASLHPRMFVIFCLAVFSVNGVSALYSANGPVTLLTPTNFQSKIKSGGVWLVEFFAPWCGHCKSLQPEYEKAAAALKGVGHMAAVDADEHKSLGGEYQIKGFPTIKLFYADESGKIKSSDYTGGRTAKDMVTFVADKAKALALKRLGEKPDKKSGGGGGGSSGGHGGGGGGSGGGGAKDPFYSGTDVVPLTDDSFESSVMSSGDLWIVEFYAPWCGHCKNLKPEYIQAAASLKGKVKLGAVNCDDHKAVCGQYEIRGFPTIKFFGQNKRSPEDYQEGRDASSIVAFGNSKWGSVAPPPEVVELTDTKVFGKQCTGSGDAGSSKQLCVLAFLPDIIDSKAAGRKDYVKALKKVADAFKDRPFSYLWVEGGRQAALETAVGVGGFGYPAAVALNPREKKYSTLKGAFSVESLKTWIESLRKGGEPVAPVAGGALPDIATTPAWDGKDAVVEEEEEFSLEDIMGE